MIKEKNKFNFYLLILIGLLSNSTIGNTTLKKNIAFCSKETKLPELLIGTWVNKSDKEDFIVKYTENGKYLGTVKFNGINEPQVKGFKDKDEIISINCHELIIKTKSDPRQVYIKRNV
jgi:hypothetical protein